MKSRDRSHRRDWPLLAVLIGLSLFLNLYSIDWALPHPAHLNLWQATWAFDTITPVRALGAAREGFAWGDWSREDFTYPLAHYMVLAAASAPYVGYLLLSGGLEGQGSGDYPYGLSDPVSALTVLTLIARLVSVLMATGIVVVTFLIVRELFERRAAFFAALMVAVCNTLIFYAHVNTLDVPYVFWIMLALYAFTLILRAGRARHYLALGVFAGMAFATKDQAYALLVLLPLPILWFHLRRRPPQRWSLPDLARAFKGWELPLGVAGFGVTYALANNLLLNFPRFVLHTRALIERRVYDRVLDPATLDGHVRLFLLSVSYTARAVGLPLFIVGLAGLAYCLVRYRGRTWPYLAPMLSYYGLFIVGSAFYVHARHVLPFVILLAFFGGKLLSDLTASQRRHPALRYGLIGLLFAYSLLYGFSQDLTLANDPRAQADRWIAAHVPAGSTIEVYSHATFLPHFAPQYEVARLAFDADGHAAGLQARAPDYVLISEQEYRPSADHDEAQALARALREDAYLAGLWDGSLGYERVASFKYRLHDWFHADIVYGQNPRITIFRRSD